MYQESIYESAPTEREGQRIDELVPEAIHRTANATTDGGRNASRPRAAGQPASTVRNLKVLAASEAALMVILVLAWVLT